MQQVNVKCYVRNVVAWKMYNIKYQGLFVTYVCTIFHMPDPVAD